MGLYTILYHTISQGRVACEISTMDELIGTELVFNNILTHLEPAEIVALLSCFVFEQKNKEKAPEGLTPKLMVWYDTMFHKIQIVLI